MVFKKKKLKKNKGILFWITGLSGTGKTAIAESIKKFVIERYGKTIIISGDDIRDIFNLKKFKKIERLKLAKQYTLLVQHITNQNINVVFSVVALFDEVRNFNKKKIKNYVEIFIKSDLTKIINFKKKPLYKKKNSKNIWGIDIKPEFPKRPDIILENNFDEPIQKLSIKLQKKIIKLLY